MFKAGFVAIVGRPNAGKSTLINALLGARLSVVSAKPQTTRHRILGIMEDERFQACLLDTPGLIDNPEDPLQKSLRVETTRALREDADAVLFVVDAAAADPASASWDAPPVTPGVPVILVLNKCDLAVGEEKLVELERAYAGALKATRTIRASALKGQGVDEIRSAVVSTLPVGEPFYEKGQLSDRWERFFASEIIRGEVFHHYSDEIPHATAVLVEVFREKKGKPDEIFATLFVERDGQKGIILGKGGKDIQKVRERAVKELESFLGRRVELELWVKVRKNWRKDPRSLMEFGYLEKK
ncbi:MAG: GTPase Era [Elusimicrobiota bacterium]|nr:GTPase Era [Elusimicrobiota bacterium]